MTRYPQARDFIYSHGFVEAPRLNTPPVDPKLTKPIAERLREIAAQSAEEPTHVLIERMARLLAEHFDQRR